MFSSTRSTSRDFVTPSKAIRRMLSRLATRQAWFTNNGRISPATASLPLGFKMPGSQNPRKR